MISSTLRMATIHTIIKESVRSPPLTCARLPRDTSPGYSWVARTLSQFTSLYECWGIVRISDHQGY
jgi:hypothetical protein